MDDLKVSLRRLPADIFLYFQKLNSNREKLPQSQGAQTKLLHATKSKLPASRKRLNLQSMFRRTGFWRTVQMWRFSMWKLWTLKGAGARQIPDALISNSTALPSGAVVTTAAKRIRSTIP